VRRFTWEHGAGDGFPAFQRFQLATPQALAELGAAHGARPFARVVVGRAKSYSPSLDDPHGEGADRLPRPVALDRGGDLASWRDLDWRDARTGGRLRVTTDHGEALRPNVVLLETLADVARRWAHGRERPLPAGIVVDPLLVRRTGRGAGRFYGGRDQLTHREVDDAALLVEAVRALGPGLAAEITGLAYNTVRRWGRRRARPGTVRAALTGLRANGWTLPRLVDVIRDAQAGRGAPHCAAGAACRAGAPIVTQVGAFCRTCRRERRRVREAKRRRARRLTNDGVRFVACHALGCRAEVVGSGAERGARDRGWAQVAGTWWCAVHVPRSTPRLCNRCGRRPAARGRARCGPCSRATADAHGT
jgi:hypothetical protein